MPRGTCRHTCGVFGWWVIPENHWQNRDNTGKLAGTGGALHIPRVASPFWPLVLPASPNWAFPPACAGAALRGFTAPASTPGPWSQGSCSSLRCGLHGQGFQAQISVLSSSLLPKLTPVCTKGINLWGGSAASALLGAGSVSGHSTQVCKRDTSSAGLVSNHNHLVFLPF